MAINKIKINGEVKIDLTNDTVRPADVRKGKTFHGADGETVEGALDLSIITAEPSDVRHGKVFVNENGEPIEGTLTFDYTLREFVDGLEVLSVADDTVLTDWKEIIELPDYFCKGGCNGKLKTVRFDNVQIIGQAAFAEASGLENAIFPECIDIDGGAFGKISSNGAAVPLTGEVYFPKVKTIRSQAFTGIQAEHLDLPECTAILTERASNTPSYNIGHNVFANSALKTINLPKVEEVGWEMFSGSALEEVNFPKLRISAGDTFNQCRNLKSVNLPQATDLGPRAFRGCSSLTEVNLPNLTTLSPKMFTNSPNIAEINLPNVTTLMVVDPAMQYFGNTTEDDMFGWKEQPAYPSTCVTKKVLLPKLDFDTKISWGNFFYPLGNAVEELTLGVSHLGDPEDVTTYYMLIDGMSIHTLNLPNCQTICSSACCYCPNLENISIPVCKSMGYNAFGNCKSLKKVELPAIEEMYAPFASCSNLQSVVIRTPDKVCSLRAADAFEGHHPMIFNIYVPDNLVDSYKVAENWVQYAVDIKPLSSYQGGEI